MLTTFIRRHPLLLYYGDELGILTSAFDRNIKSHRRDQRLQKGTSVSEEYMKLPVLSRDNGRTPMQWTI